MKLFKNILALAIVTLFAFSCKNEAKPEVVTSPNSEITTNNEVAKLDPNANYAKAEFTIEGMTCAMGCAKTIEKKMAKMEGVKSATVDFDKKLAMVEYDDAKVTQESLENTVTSVADQYSVKDMKTVESFTKDKKECSAKCKEKCANKTDAEKMACKEACKKTCAEKAKKA
ncbi:heavy-metal-associated domain-containing protein [Mesoflavibacter sp. SCSIO 43206]|uniref:heavy-metal-associated domain-containing protein n=1 Tax=Mesoflavibacter sp. SCSIO 43206 TaxID=2779362 RepID=UPI001CAA0DCC|nr:heavy metal-associated domain-containing protein [Mesoflavibacter sp. SCSIO 43206]UAB76224.1 heavy-metal-associated domain-containing protein [Mesoflavibacter sp. SCSIO 43206]